jgi:hypothetical protein
MPMGISALSGILYTIGQVSIVLSFSELSGILYQSARTWQVSSSGHQRTLGLHLSALGRYLEQYS